jgi:hypothetical protein
MAVITEVREHSRQELGVLACVRIVTSRTAHAYGCVHGLLFEQALVMASEAQGRLIGREAFGDVVLFFVRNIRGIDGRMARRTSHRHRGMYALFRSKVGMTIKAINRFRSFFLWCDEAIVARNRKQHRMAGKKFAGISLLLLRTSWTHGDERRGKDSIIVIQNQASSLSFVNQCTKRTLR